MKLAASRYIAYVAQEREKNTNSTGYAHKAQKYTYVCDLGLGLEGKKLRKA